MSDYRWEWEVREDGTYGWERGDLVPNLLQKDREVVQCERVIRIRVVQVKQLADFRELGFCHRNAALDTLDWIAYIEFIDKVGSKLVWGRGLTHDLPLVVVDLPIFVLVRLVDELEEVAYDGRLNLQQQCRFAREKRQMDENHILYSRLQ